MGTMCKFGILLLATCLVATASAGRLSRIVKRATGLPKYNPDLYTTTKSPYQNSPYGNKNSEPYVNPNAPYQGNQDYQNYWKIDPNAPTSGPFKEEDLWDHSNSNHYFYPGGTPPPSTFSTTQSSSSKKGYTGWNNGYVNYHYDNTERRAYGSELQKWDQQPGYVGNAPNNGFKPANQGYNPAVPKYEPSKFGTESPSAPWSKIEISSGPYAPRHVFYPYSDFSPEEAERIGLRTTTAANPGYNPTNQGYKPANQGYNQAYQDYKPYGNSDSRPYPSWDYQNQKNYQQG